MPLTEDDFDQRAFLWRSAGRADRDRLSEQADIIVLLATTQSQVQHFTRAMYIGQSANHFTAPGGPRRR